MRRHLILLILAVVGLAATPATGPLRSAGAQEVAAPAEWTVEQLAASLAQVQQVDGVFHERKEMSVLEQPLSSSGLLHYRAPSFLEKDVLEPEPQTYQIDGDRVIVETPKDGRHEFAVDQYPGVRPLVESVRATLAGDQAALERHFHLQLSGQREAWTLSLKPIDEKIAERIVAIVISGAENRLLRVETVEANGDHTVMTVTPVGQ